MSCHLPVFHEPRPRVPHYDVVRGGEEDGRPDGGHHPPVVTPPVPQLVDGVQQLRELTLALAGGRRVVHPLSLSHPTPATLQSSDSCNSGAELSVQLIKLHPAAACCTGGDLCYNLQM